MALDIIGYRDKHKDFYGDKPLEEVAKDAFSRGGYDKKYSDYNTWKKESGIDVDIEEDRRLRNPTFEDKLRSKVDGDGNIVKSFLQGGAEGITTELPSMVGGALQFVGSHLPFKGIEKAGKSLKDWAEEKRQELYGPEIERTGLDRIVYEGTKMLAPSLIPGGIVGTVARGAKGVNALLKAGKAAEATAAAKSATNIAGGSVASLFGLSQAQQTKDTAEQAGVDPGLAPYMTGAIEAAGEFLGTKYLAKLFRLDEAEIVKRGTKEFVKDLIKTIGVETGTEIGQQAGEAGVEKYSGIRPNANPIMEAVDVIGPTAFMTILTGGLAGAANKLRSQNPEEKDAAQYIEKLKAGAMFSMAINEGLTTGQYEGTPFTSDHAIEVIKEAQNKGVFDDTDIDRFKDKYPQLRDGLNGVIAENLTKKIDEAVTSTLTNEVTNTTTKITPAVQDVPSFEPATEDLPPASAKRAAKLQDQITRQEDYLARNANRKGETQYEKWAADLEQKKAKLAELTKPAEEMTPLTPAETSTIETPEVKGAEAVQPAETSQVKFGQIIETAKGQGKVTGLIVEQNKKSVPIIELADGKRVRLDTLEEHKIESSMPNKEKPQIEAKSQADLLYKFDNTGEIGTEQDLIEKLKERDDLSDQMKVAIMDYDKAVETDTKEYGKRSGLPEQAAEKVVALLKKEQTAPLSQTPTVGTKEVKAGESAKEPWQMTFEERKNYDLQKTKSSIYNPKGEIPTDNVLRGIHRAEIETAQIDGKIIPPEVLKDYPELQKESTKATSVSANKPELKRVIDVYGRYHYIDTNELTTDRNILKRYNSNGERPLDDTGLHRGNIVDENDVAAVEKAKKTARLRSLENKAQKKILSPEELEEAKKLHQEIFKESTNEKKTETVLKKKETETIHKTFKDYSQALGYEYPDSVAKAKSPLAEFQKINEKKLKENGINSKQLIQKFRTDKGKITALPEAAPVKDSETINLVLHEMRSGLESGSPGGLQGQDEDGNPIYAKSGYPDWFTDLIKKYGNKKTSPTGEEEINAGEIAESKGDLISGASEILETEGYSTEQLEAAHDEISSFFDEMSKGEEVKTERTKAGEQATISGTSEAENFSLLNPETEISPKLSEQVKPKNADMFAEKEGEAKPEPAKEKTPYFTFAKAKRLMSLNPKDLTDEQLQKEYVRARDYQRYANDTQAYGDILLKGDYFADATTASSRGVAPRDMFMAQNLNTTLDEFTAERNRRKESSEPQSTTADSGEELTPADDTEYTPAENLIHRDVAMRSHHGTSFDPEKRGQQEIEGFYQELTDIYDKLKGQAKSEEAKKMLVSEMRTLERNLASKKNGLLQAHSGLYSSMIAGPANFPVRRMEKKNAAYDNKVNEYLEFKKKAVKAISKKLTELTTQEAGGETEVLKKKIADLEKLQDTMKQTNAVIRKNISDAEKIELLKPIVGEKHAAELLKPDVLGRKGFAQYQLTNNLASIKRNKERLAELENRDERENKEIAFDGGYVAKNSNDDRIQIFYNTKPSPEIISQLKSKGFHWSPSNKAWQRQWTKAAEYETSNLIGKDINKTDKGVEMYSVKSKDFSSRVDDFVSGKIMPGNVIDVLDTPPVLQSLGVDNLPIIMTYNTMEKAIDRKHGLTPDMIKQLPEQIADPIMIFDSATHADSLVVMTELVHDGKTIVAAIRLSKTMAHHEVNEIISVHPREKDGHFIGWIKQGLLRYQNRQKSREWFRSRGLRLPKEETATRDFKNKILFDYDIVKDKYSAANRVDIYKLPNLAEVQDIFKGQQVTQLSSGQIWIKTIGGRHLTIMQVDHISADEMTMNIGYSRSLKPTEKIAGAYLKAGNEGQIRLVRGQADKWTLAHESVHFMEDIGVLSDVDVAALRGHIKRLAREGKFETRNKNDIGGSEDRAEFLASELQKEPVGMLGRIINKIQDFIDKLVNAFGIRTVRGIQRDVKTGEIYSKETNEQREARLDLEGGQYSLRQQTDPSASSDPKVLNQQWDGVKSRLDEYNVTGGARNIIDDIKNTADEYLGAISTRLGNIHPSIKNTLRKFEYRRGIIATERINKILPFIKKVDKMEKDDKAAFDLARKNSDTATIKSIINKYGLGEEYRELRTLLDSMYDDAINVGYEVHKKGEYHPRVLKDSKGFLEYFYKQQNWPVLQDAIRAKETELQRYLDDDEKANLINNLLRGYPSGNITLGRPGQLKERMVEQVTPEINKFYMDSDAALLTYINSVTDAVEARKLFGKSKDNSMPLFGKTKNYPLDETIGGYVLRLIDSGTITPAQEQELRNILSARFNETGTGGIFSLYKNLSYIDTMGSPTSAITQIGDMAWSIYRNGLFSTLSSAGKAIVGKSQFKKEDLGIERIATEFADSSKSSQAVAKVFKWVGLEKMDNIGKEALINSSYDAAQKKSVSDPEGLRKKLEPVFGNETDQLIQDFKNNVISENVKLYLFNELSDFQPISLSEMPEKYLTGGNGRIFYMLKSFTLKQFDVYRREIFQKIGNEATRVEGIRNLIFLSICFALANAGADELKDLLLGRKTTLKDRTVDNLLRLFGISKFVTWKARTEGVGSAMVRQIMPPFKAIDAISKDIATAGNERGLEITQSIPLIGKLYYWWFGKGGQSPELGKYTEYMRNLNKHEKNIKELRDEGKPVYEYIKDNPDARYIKFSNKVQSDIGKLRSYRKKLIKRGADDKVVRSLDNRISAMMRRFNEVIESNNR